MRLPACALQPALLAGMCGIVVAWESGPLIIRTLPQRDHRANPGNLASLSLSAEGRYVAFVSAAQLVEADTNACKDIYVLDTVTGRATLETLTAGYKASNGDSSSPRLDGSGRHLVFTSVARNLADRVPAPGTSHVFLRDRMKRTTRLLSVDRDGRPARRDSWAAAISLDGRTVAFTSSATTLVAAEDRNGEGPDVYLVHLRTGHVQRVSVTSAGEQPATGMSYTPSVSADGHVVAFMSTAALSGSPNDANTGGWHGRTDRKDVYVHDVETRHTIRVSRAIGGGEPNGGSFHPAISANGRYVAFASDASNFVPNDRNGVEDVFVTDLKDGTILLVSRTPRARPGNGKSRYPAISADGSLVAFQSEAADLVCTSRCPPHERDVNMVWDVFLRDRRRGVTMRISADDGDEWMEASAGAAIASSAPFLAFSSRHPLRSGHTAADSNAFLVKLPLLEP